MRDEEGFGSDNGGGAYLFNDQTTNKTKQRFRFSYFIIHYNFFGYFY